MSHSQALRYHAQEKALVSLLHRNLQNRDLEDGWFTMDSMRSVDSESHVKVVWPLKNNSGYE